MEFKYNFCIYVVLLCDRFLWNWWTHLEHMAYIGTWIALVTIFTFLETECYFNHPYTWTIAHNIYKITNHPYAWTLLLHVINDKSPKYMNTKEYNIKVSSLHIQSGLVLCDFVLTRLKNLQHFWIYMKIFGLTQFGIDNPWLHLSCAGG